MENDLPYPTWVCSSCGREAMRLVGWTPPRNHLATYRAGKCDLCGAETDVTEPRDFGHPWKYMRKLENDGGEK